MGKITNLHKPKEDSKMTVNEFIEYLRLRGSEDLIPNFLELLAEASK